MCHNFSAAHGYPQVTMYMDFLEAETYQDLFPYLGFKQFRTPATAFNQNELLLASLVLEAGFCQLRHQKILPGAVAGNQVLG